MMDLKTFKALLDRIPLSTGLHFAGMSECFLNPDCAKMMVYAHQKNYRMAVLTTLQGLALTDLYLIESIPFRSFLIHLPTDEASGYDKIRVDAEYLKILDRVSKSTIKVRYMTVAGTVHEKVKALLKDKLKSLLESDKPFSDASTLAGNSDVKSSPVVKKRGVLRCGFNLDLNALLPNGDVQLCCMDYGLQHRLGTLMEADYEALFEGKEFLKVKEGLQDASLDTLCRICEFAQNVSLFARIYNPLAYSLKDIHSFQDALRDLRRIPSYVRSILFPR